MVSSNDIKQWYQDNNEKYEGNNEKYEKNNEKYEKSTWPTQTHNAFNGKQLATHSIR